MQSVSENHLIATFQLSSAASLNFGRSQNGILGNGLRRGIKMNLKNKGKGKCAIYHDLLLLQHSFYPF